MGNSKPFKTWREAEQGWIKVHDCASDTDLFMSRCFPLLLRSLSEIKGKRELQLTRNTMLILGGLIGLQFLASLIWIIVRFG